MSVQMLSILYHFLFSPLSVWVHNVEELDQPEEEKTSLDELIDKLYEDIEKGRVENECMPYSLKCCHIGMMTWCWEVTLNPENTGLEEIVALINVLN